MRTDQAQEGYKAELSSAAQKDLSSAFLIPGWDSHWVLQEPQGSCAAHGCGPSLRIEAF